MKCGDPTIKYKGAKSMLLFQENECYYKIMKCCYKLVKCYYKIMKCGKILPLPGFLFCSVINNYIKISMVISLLLEGGYQVYTSSTFCSRIDRWGGV